MAHNGVRNGGDSNIGQRAWAAVVKLAMVVSPATRCGAQPVCRSSWRLLEYDGHERSIYVCAIIVRGLLFVLCVTSGRCAVE